MPVDSGAPSKRFYARFRLYPKNPATPALEPEGCTRPKYPYGRFIYPGGEVEDYVWEFTPFAITLANMKAAAQGNSIDVTWETVSEVGNTGFNLYRDTSAAGPGMKLNGSLIPSQGPGSPSGFSYSYTDANQLAPGTTYYYWLEDVSEGGVATRHEPVSVPYNGAPTAVALAGFGAGAALPASLPLAGAGLAALMLAGAALAVRRRRA